MPNVRGEGQKPILVMMDEDFINEIARGLGRAGYSDRSSFIRDAVFEKLSRAGIRVDYIKALAPARVAVKPPKGGAKKKRKTGAFGFKHSLSSSASRKRPMRLYEEGRPPADGVGEYAA